jgi:hypothetical protein
MSHANMIEVVCQAESASTVSYAQGKTRELEEVARGARRSPRAVIVSYFLAYLARKSDSIGRAARGIRIPSASLSAGD